MREWMRVSDFLGPLDRHSPCTPTPIPHFAEYDGGLITYRFGVRVRGTAIVCLLGPAGISPRCNGHQHTGRRTRRCGADGACIQMGAALYKASARSRNGILMDFAAD